MAHGGVEHVVIMGVSGSGKTTVARLLAAKLGRPFAEADDMHPPASVERMAAGTPLTDAERLPWVAKVRDWMAVEARLGHSTVLTCSALTPVYRDMLRAAPGRVRFVHLAPPDAQVASRMAGRTEHFFPAALLESQLATLVPLGPDEDGVTIEIHGRPDQVADAALQALLDTAEPADSSGPGG